MDRFVPRDDGVVGFVLCLVCLHAYLTVRNDDVVGVVLRLGL